MKEILLYSAGLDSYFAKKYLQLQGRKFESIYYDIQCKYSKQEIETVQKFNESVSVHYEFIGLKQSEHEDAFIPNRNFILALMTQSLYYDCEKIWIGGTLSDRVDDNNKEVFIELSNFLSKVHKKNIEITSPFWGLYKTEVIDWFFKKRLSELLSSSSPVSGEKASNIIYSELLDNTFSCYYPLKDKISRQSMTPNRNFIEYKTYECLSCPACFRKSVELNSIELFRNFDNKKIINKYKTEFENSIHVTPRSKATLDYIAKLNEK